MRLQNASAGQKQAGRKQASLTLCSVVRRRRGAKTLLIYPLEEIALSPVSCVVNQLSFGIWVLCYVTCVSYCNVQRVHEPATRSTTPKKRYNRPLSNYLQTRYE